jgi:hypothetical protein
MFRLLLLLAWCFIGSVENLSVSLTEYLLGIGWHQDSLKAIYYNCSGK